MIASPYTNKIFKEFLYFQRSPLEIFVLLLTTTLEWCFILGEQRITWHYLTLVSLNSVNESCFFVRNGWELWLHGLVNAQLESDPTPCVHRPASIRLWNIDVSRTRLWSNISLLRLRGTISMEASWFHALLICAAAAAKSLQSCPTLCDPIDGSPPGSAVSGILQARTLEWVLICEVSRIKAGWGCEDPFSGKKFLISNSGLVKGLSHTYHFCGSKVDQTKFKRRQ